MKKIKLLLITLLVFMTSGASAAQPEKSSFDQITKPASHSKMGITAAETPQNSEPISGKVLETMDSGGYSYILLQKKNGDKVWVAVPTTPVKVGNQMSFMPGTEMKGFESKSLKRTFASIIFSGGPVTKHESVKTPATKKDQTVSPGSKGSSTAKEKIKVAKATGANAVTVEEAFRNSAKLDKKQVVIRGQVVKVSTGIMGKNWIHIQDGTGTQAKGNHNLVCTSLEMAEVGDVIVVSGTLAKDRDFGSGYKYNSIVENAKFKK